MTVQEFNEICPIWQQQAACKGQCAPVFFPPLHFEGKQARLSRERRAKAICAGCEVRAECLDFALKTAEPHGVWGGLSELERRALVDANRSVTRAVVVRRYADHRGGE